MRARRTWRPGCSPWPQPAASQALPSFAPAPAPHPPPPRSIAAAPARYADPGQQMARGHQKGRPSRGAGAGDATLYGGLSGTGRRGSGLSGAGRTLYGPGGARCEFFCTKVKHHCRNSMFSWNLPRATFSKSMSFSMPTRLKNEARTRRLRSRSCEHRRRSSSDARRVAKRSRGPRGRPRETTRNK